MRREQGELTALVAQRTRALRKHYGWSQEDLARQVPGLDRSIIANMEGGRRASVSVDEVAGLCRAFGVSISDMLDAEKPLMLHIPVG